MMFKWKLKRMEVRLLIFVWFTTCMCLLFFFNQIWFVLEPTLLGSCLVFFIFLWCLIHFVQEFLSFYFFLCLIYFFLLWFFFGMFSGQTIIFGLVYGQTKISDRPDNKKSRSNDFNTLFVCHVVVKGSFGLRVCLTNTN